MTTKHTVFNNASQKGITIYQSIASDQLLNTCIHKQIILLLKKYSTSSTDVFNKLFEPIIINLANFLQVLPYAGALKSNTSDITWIEFALLQAVRALKLEKLCILPEKKKIDSFLWIYVIFSAALLNNIGKIASHFTIHACNELGTIKKKWNPLCSSLYPSISYYVISDVSLGESSHFKTLTPLIAKMLMPTDGFAWITQDPTALKIWLEALNSTDTEHTILTPLLNFWPGYMYFNDQDNLIQELITQSKLRGFPLSALWKELDTLYQQLIKNKLAKKNKLIDPSNKIGKSFLQWLKKAIDNKTISTNQPHSLVHIKKDGIILIYPDIFKEFCNDSNQYKDWVVVYKQFNHLGLTKKSGGDTLFSKFFYDSDSDSSHNPTADSIRRKIAITLCPPTNFLSPLTNTTTHHAPSKIHSKIK